MGVRLQFTKNYLPNLQTRQKWQRSSKDITVDSVVLIIDPSLPTAQWPTGRVVKAIANPDGCIRGAEVKVKDKVYMRPVARLMELPELQDDTKDT